MSNNLNTNYSHLQKDTNMTRPTRHEAESAPDTSVSGTSASAAASIVRLRSEDLFRQKREVEIDHDGRIYRLRLTQLNKLILTA